MTPLEEQIAALAAMYPGASGAPIAGAAATLIQVPNYKLPKGWNRELVTILFVAPTGFPAAQPDCFWVEPGGLRLASGGTPQATNDSNPIPGVGPRGTWFSWHLQAWNPNTDSLIRYVNVIHQRLEPAR